MPLSFTEVSREDIPTTRTREGKVSTHLIKSFLDSGLEVVEVDTSGEDKKMESIRSTVSNYVKRHELPVKVFTAGGKLYLELSEAQAEQYAKDNAAAKAKPEGADQAAA